MKQTAAVLGGDLRQVWLARLLLDDGWDVVTWGLEQGDAPCAVPLNQALEAKLLILPLPVCRAGKLVLPLTDIQLDAEQLWSKLRYDQLLIGGMTGELSPRLMADFGLTLLDYYDREEAQVANAVPTALAIGRPLVSLAAQGVLDMLLLGGQPGLQLFDFVKRESRDVSNFLKSILPSLQHAESCCFDSFFNALSKAFRTLFFPHIFHHFTHFAYSFRIFFQISGALCQ